MTDEPAADYGIEQIAAMWLDEIDAASETEKNWRELAQKTCDIYRAEDKATQHFDENNTSFNILFSNVQTIIPAIYNSTPTPDLRPRYNAKDEAARLTCQALERCVTYSFDTYDFDGVIAGTLFDAELAGRGVPRVRFEPTFDEFDRLVDAKVYCESVEWDSFRVQPAQKWDDVNWIAFKLLLDKDQIAQLSGEEPIDIKYDYTVSGKQEEQSQSKKCAEMSKRAMVWEIWDKKNKKVVFLAPSSSQKIIKIEDDPLELVGFFPVPRPIYGIDSYGSLVPVPPYEMYRKQAEELNIISRRITNLTKAMKWHGAYLDVGEGEGFFQSLQDAKDGELVPYNGNGLALDTGGLDKLFWTRPIDKIANVLAQLYTQRDQIKSVIYEITGISDILRGASVASETATAQSIKAQWGSLRVQRKQAEVQRLIRDIIRIKTDIIASFYPPELIARISGVELPDQVLVKDDVMRSIRIDVETDSTVRGDLSRFQQTMSNFLQGTGQYLQAVSPLVQSGFMPANMAIKIYNSYSRQFKLGKDIDDALEMYAQQAEQAERQPQQQDQSAQAEQQMQTQKHQMEMEKLGAETQAAVIKSQAETQKAAAQMQMMQPNIVGLYGQNA